MRECPGGEGSWRNRRSRRQSSPYKSLLDIAEQAALAAEQMGDAMDIEPQPIRSIHLDKRRPASGPFRQHRKEPRITSRIGGNGDQCRIERPGIGQSSAGPRAAFGSGASDGMDDEAVRAFEGQDDWRVRREGAVLGRALDRQMRKPDGKHPSHE